MNRLRRPVAVATLLALAAAASAADFEFYGRTGDAIEIDLGALPGVAGGTSFSGLSIGGFSGHTVLTSSQLSQGDFASDGRLWVFANPAAGGDADPAARGFQGRLEGSVLVNGQPKTFAVTVQPGYTGAGAGAVQQSLERINRSANNALYVAQQQQRLRYLGFVRRGGAAVSVSGAFDAATDEAMQTFQAAFDGGVNATQDSSSQADGIVGPTTAAWLNAANAPQWDELIDPDPQVPGTFSLGALIGDFDILPARDPGGARTGLTPQSERFGVSWALETFKAGAALAKQTTRATQLINAISTVDGYGSAAVHATHRVGLDLDLHVDVSTWNMGNGSLSLAESLVVQHALAYFNAPGVAGVQRILTSNQDILSGINAQAPGLAVYDSSGGHQNHLHIDIRVPTREEGLANVPGDFNFDNVVDAADYTIWRDGLGATLTPGDYATWQANFGAVRGGGSFAVSVPEPATYMAALAVMLMAPSRRARR